MELLKGNKHQDARGIITYNNEFDATNIKRIYTIENTDTDFVRGWQGHAIEQRWFACMNGSYRISVIAVDSFENPSRNLPVEYFELKNDVLTYLQVPAGCVTAIRALEPGSKLLVLADYMMGEVQDEYRFELDYFREFLAD